MIKTISILSIVLIFSTLAYSQGNGHQGIDVAILGDSNTWLGGDDCSKPKGWNSHFKQIFAPKSCVSYARSGATWTNTKNTEINLTEYSGSITDNNVIYNQVQRLLQAVEQGNQANPKLIIIAAGTNDGWFSKKRPGLFDDNADNIIKDDSIIYKKPNEVCTLLGSIVMACKILQKQFPEAQIILLTPLQSTAVTIEMISRIGDVIENCGKILGIDVIRQDKICCVDCQKEKNRKVNTYDGTHTSAIGAKTNGEILAKEISRIIEKTE